MLYTKEQMWLAFQTGFDSFKEIDENNPLDDAEYKVGVSQQRFQDLSDEFDIFITTIKE